MRKYIKGDEKTEGDVVILWKVVWGDERVNEELGCVRSDKGPNDEWYQNQHPFAL